MCICDKAADKPVHRSTTVEPLKYNYSGKSFTVDSLLFCYQWISVTS